MKIIFFGTPDFAVPSLDLINKEFDLLAVVTAIDKPAGRGHHLQISAVKEWALDHGVTVLQPKNLKSELFLKKLQKLNADIFVVVAFRMLPIQVWHLPPLGTINLHASLLPDYRGAAPIQRAIMAGEKTSGISCFILKEQIDTGDIIAQKSMVIGDDETGGSLHDRMSIDGAGLLTESINKLKEKSFFPIPQVTDSVKIATKIFPEDTIIKWDNTALSVYNFIRALAPYPLAKALYKENYFKIIRASITTENTHHPTGYWNFDLASNTLKVACNDYYLNIEEIQPPSKKKMSTKEFINGLKNK